LLLRVRFDPSGTRCELDSGRAERVTQGWPHRVWLRGFKVSANDGGRKEDWPRGGVENRPRGREGDRDVVVVKGLLRLEGRSRNIEHACLPGKAQNDRLREGIVGWDKGCWRALACCMVPVDQRPGGRVG